MKKLILFLILLFSPAAFASEVVFDLKDETAAPVINEELRRLYAQLRSIETHLESTTTELEELVTDSINSLVTVPTGGVLQWTTGTAPTGFLLCDGAAVSRTTYADLFAVIGTTYGSGDGSTTFNLPDLRGRAPIGAGQGSGLTNRALAATGGAETHALSEAEMPSHAHNLVNINSGSEVQIAHQDTGSGGTIAHISSTNNVAVNLDRVIVGNSGSGSAHNNMMPFVALHYIIKT